MEEISGKKRAIHPHFLLGINVVPEDEEVKNTANDGTTHNKKEPTTSYAVQPAVNEQTTSGSAKRKADNKLEVPRRRTTKKRQSVLESMRFENLAYRENKLAIEKSKLEELKKRNKLIEERKKFLGIISANVAEQTILYARQKNNHKFLVSIEEIKNFTAILLLSGYHKLLRQKLFWSLDENCGVDMVSSAMARNRFLEIKKYLHLADNYNIDHDKMFKLRPLTNILNENFRQWCIFHKDLSIDEAMVKYFGNHCAKQFIRGKPVRFGFKDWMLCSSTGYCYAFEPYCRKNNERKDESFGLGGNVLTSLLQHLENPNDHIVYFDNFFTTIDLNRLKAKGIRATGTIRENRQKNCPLQASKMMDKNERGSCDHRFDTNNELLVVKWKDNRVCSMATNHDFIEPFNNVKR
jgi:hypothetical protein